MKQKTKKKKTMTKKYLKETKMDVSKKKKPEY